ncbi:MAG: cardiolipin synthase [Verrucomicrobia bacterium]|nr:MAG: cardiolipin synthase [Verrucomicrobiota bacterium]
MNNGEAMWESETLYLDGDKFYAALINEIESATSSVDMEVYTFEGGLLAERLCESFQRAHVRGVKVRLVFDHWGSSEIDYGLHQRLLEAGVKTRIFRGLPWRILDARGAGLTRKTEAWVSQFLRRIKRLNRGFHRKVTIIDGVAAWVSSLNVSDMHLKEVQGRGAWSDAGVRVSGPEVRVLSDAFRRVFGERLPADPRKSLPGLVLLNDSRFLRGRMNNRFRERIHLAKSRVWIQNPYFLPPRRFLRALCRSARQGTDVRILVPEKNDHQFIRWISLGLMGLLLKNGVRVLEYQGSFAHKKVLIVDDQMFLGSVNWNYRSFLHDLEVEVEVTHPSSKQQLEASFQSDEAHSQELTELKFAALPFWLQALSRLLFFFRYWC